MWQGIEGHDSVVERFRRNLAAGRLASTHLFVGPEGIGKRTFALRLAKVLLCGQADETALLPCDACESCRLADAGNHPDLLKVQRPSDRSFIPVELFVGDRDHRMRAGLCHDIAMKPFLGGRRIAVIDDADALNQEGANCLLKTLEEPPPCSVLILVGTSAARQLPTIRSRCQIVRFALLETEQVARLLVSQGLVDSDEQAARLARRSKGSLTRAMTLADPELAAFRDRLIQALAEPPAARTGLGADVMELVDAAGREAPLRRARLAQVIGFAVDYYSALMRASCGAGPTAVDSVADEPMADDLARVKQDGAPAGQDGVVTGAIERAVERAIGRGGGDPDRAAASLDRSLTALDHLHRNANPATLVEAWMTDLGDDF